MSNNTSYDKALLDEAPEVTREQRQRFYDADLLRDDANGQHTTDASGGRDLEAGNGAARSKEYSSLPPTTTLSPPSTPWYKTRKGIIGLAVLAIVIIAAVIGGAVGGTQANKSSDNNADSSLLTASDSASQLPPSISASPTDASSETQGEESGTIGVATATTTAPPPDEATGTGTAAIGTGPVSPEPPQPSADEGASDVAAAIVGQGRL